MLHNCTSAAHNLEAVHFVGVPRALRHAAARLIASRV